jgi:integrase/recombinase XerC
MSSLQSLATRYIAERRKRGEITALTADTTRVHLDSFVHSHGNRPVGQLGPPALERWLEQMERQGLASSTRAVRLSTLKGFARWCVRNRYVARDWTLDAPRIRRTRMLTRDVTEDHVGLLLDVCRDGRERLIVELMFVAALRCVEICRLNVDDYDLITRTLHITGKGGHERRGHVVGPLRTALDSYLAEQGHRHGPIVRRADGRPGRLSPSTVSHLVSRLFADAGLKIRPYDGRSAHGIRACSASDLMDSCGEPQIVQEHLGHVNLATTNAYLRKVGSKRVREAIEQRFAA